MKAIPIAIMSILNPAMLEKELIIKPLSIQVWRLPSALAKELAEHIIKNPEAFKVLQDAMVEIVGAKLVPVEQERKR